MTCMYYTYKHHHFHFRIIIVYMVNPVHKIPIKFLNS